MGADFTAPKYGIGDPPPAEPAQPAQNALLAQPAKRTTRTSGRVCQSAHPFGTIEENAKYFYRVPIVARPATLGSGTFIR
jgi:hypothetical protein